MTTETFSLPARRVTARTHDVLETIYSAPAPRWGSSATDHGKFLSYLVGSMVTWVVLPLVVTGAFAALLSL
ncbi:hypothetical protein [Cellulomonas sp. URHE0023]|uniref:hypothetical protein n=1 Tax=Cellulomonas sp. URHE0023 TaxID=1380354 RepID=UPI000484703C|nr:hypothetical protein [Cellulomonas sp. URHE0023]